MQKKLLYVLIGLMSISLAGIIAVQIYWIVDSIEEKEEQFSFAVNQSLINVANRLENNEINKYLNTLERLRDSLGVKPDGREVREYLLIQRNDKLEETATYKNSLLTETYKLDPQLLELDLDSVILKKLYNQTSKTTTTDSQIDGIESRQDRFERLNKFEQVYNAELADAILEFNNVLPVTSRTSKDVIAELIREELDYHNIETDFEYAIYQGGYATRLLSENFEFKENATWATPVFDYRDSDGDAYKLLINLPGRERFILSSVTGMALLSLVFTAVIVIAYSNAINQIFKQRQISQIKTDFINNMTHEFKTPIATINLALDSLNHPRIASDPEKVKNYLRMIREENKRMHGQVENVLQISKLEKSELNMQKERMDANLLIHEAISHIKLILDQREGVLQTHLGALRTDILANESHMTNVFVNILENAIKYSDDAPIIDVYTENVKNKIVIKIRDQGIGMSKAASRKVFQKFFREHTGDIHNVKGHGLGLAYAKRVLEEHHSEIYLESEKGKGSTFIITIPLIT
ncbi:sensor histidine kinase [Nonlabens spongiae]|nr:HAMP domain-containing sensor histidine kinase [Nonlabens spongiae]